MAEWAERRGVLSKAMRRRHWRRQHIRSVGPAPAAVASCRPRWEYKARDVIARYMPFDIVIDEWLRRGQVGESREKQSGRHWGANRRHEPLLARPVRRLRARRSRERDPDGRDRRTHGRSRAGQSYDAGARTRDRGGAASSIGSSSNARVRRGALSSELGRCGARRLRHRSRRRRKRAITPPALAAGVDQIPGGYRRSGGRTPPGWVRRSWPRCTSAMRRSIRSPRFRAARWSVDLDVLPTDARRHTRAPVEVLIRGQSVSDRHRSRLTGRSPIAVAGYATGEDARPCRRRVASLDRNPIHRVSAVQGPFRAVSAMSARPPRSSLRPAPSLGASSAHPSARRGVQPRRSRRTVNAESGPLGGSTFARSIAVPTVQNNSSARTEPSPGLRDGYRRRPAPQRYESTCALKQETPCQSSSRNRMRWGPPARVARGACCPSACRR